MPAITDRQWAELKDLITRLLAAKADEDRATALSNEADATVAQTQAVLDQDKNLASQAKVDEARAQAAFTAAQGTLKSFLDRLADPVVGIAVTPGEPTPRKEK